MKLTMVKMESEIRNIAKRKAKSLGMTLQGYIKSLIQRDTDGK